jgi:hypothetical protein
MYLLVFMPYYPQPPVFILSPSSPQLVQCAYVYILNRITGLIFLTYLHFITIHIQGNVSRLSFLSLTKFNSNYYSKILIVWRIDPLLSGDSVKSGRLWVTTL